MRSPYTAALCLLAIPFIAGGCRKDPEPLSPDGAADESLPRWEQTDQPQLRYRNILHAFERNGLGYFVRNGMLIVTDSICTVQQSYLPYVFGAMDEGVGVYPVHSDRFLVWMSAAGTQLTAWDLDEPFTTCYVSSAAWASEGVTGFAFMGQFDTNGGLMVEDRRAGNSSTYEVRYIRFQPNAGSIDVQTSTISWPSSDTVNNRFENLTTFGNTHALMPMDVPGTWFADGNGPNALPNAGFRVVKTFALHDTLYAADWFSMHMSTDGGNSWQPILSGPIYGNYHYYIIDDRIVLADLANLYWMDFDWQNQLLYLHPLNNNGLIEDPWLDGVRDMFTMGGRVYAATTIGVSSIGIEDLWRNTERSTVTTQPLMR